MASAGGDSGESLSLNLTPMLDIFSILVTFLLMSYSTDPTNHDVDQNLELPDSVTLVNMDEVPSITVTRSDILVNNKKVVTLLNGKVPPSDIQQGAVYPVYRELLEIAKVNKAAAEIIRGDEKKAKPGEITVEMDKKHDFELLRRIMLAGQQAEFITFKLLVAKDHID
ncbi:MAG: biopolymer transporter ExbD [Proteobacteria bacterium]|nr:biopolymer transporter ExbD [Pseudomonadota bacterium]